MGDKVCYRSPIGNVGKINNIGMPKTRSGFIGNHWYHCRHGKLKGGTSGRTLKAPTGISNFC